MEKIGNKKTLIRYSAGRKGGCAMKYEKPEMEIIELATKDVITTSDIDNDNIEGPGWA